MLVRVVQFFHTKTMVCKLNIDSTCFSNQALFLWETSEPEEKKPLRGMKTSPLSLSHCRESLFLRIKGQIGEEVLLNTRKQKLSIFLLHKGWKGEKQFCLSLPLYEQEWANAGLFPANRPWQPGVKLAVSMHPEARHTPAVCFCVSVYVCVWKVSMSQNVLLSENPSDNYSHRWFFFQKDAKNKKKKKRSMPTVDWSS